MASGVCAWNRRFFWSICSRVERINHLAVNPPRSGPCQRTRIWCYLSGLLAAFPQASSCAATVSVCDSARALGDPRFLTLVQSLSHSVVLRVLLPPLSARRVAVSGFSPAVFGCFCRWTFACAASVLAREHADCWFRRRDQLSLCIPFFWRFMDIQRRL